MSYQKSQCSNHNTNTEQTRQHLPSSVRLSIYLFGLWIHSVKVMYMKKMTAPAVIPLKAYDLQEYSGDHPRSHIVLFVQY